MQMNAKMILKTQNFSQGNYFMIHTPGSLAHTLKSSQTTTLGTHSGRTHIYPCRCRYPITNKDKVAPDFVHAVA